MWFVEGAHPPPPCSSNPSQHCAGWAWAYLGDCLCSTKDAVALTIGLVSIISWGVAEVPQIVANCREKSAEGLSLAFLITWIVGDLFNLIGCWLEPATLPTQFYMALLYTVTTVVLTAQTVYYGHIYPQLKAKKSTQLHKIHKPQEDDALTKEKLFSRIDEKEGNESTTVKECHRSSPISVSAPAIHRQGSSGRDLYYMSARSLSKSPMPTAGTWMVHSRDPGRTPPASARTPPTFTHDQHASREPLLESPPGMVIMVGRKLLQSTAVGVSVGLGGGGSEIGSYLGWAMAAIYMGGRLPQICLNIRRGNVEGLSPLMFMFALIGNATYVGSILVKSMDWSKIRPNMPWLVDAGGCVLLDAFILIQFAYFHYWKTEGVEDRYDL